MNRTLIHAICLLSVLSLLLAACAQKPPQLPKLPPDAVIVAFGDSLTHGTGAKPEQSYPAVLEQLTQRTVVNAGVPGEETDAGLARLPEVLDEHTPALLLLTHGGNDLLRRRPTDRTAANLRAMVKLARERDISVVLIGVPEPKLLMRETAPLYANLAEELHLPYEGEILAEIESDEALKSDAIHPNAAGYRRLAEAVYALLQRAGAL